MHTEQMIEAYYQAEGIFYPHQIDLDDLADKYSVTVTRLEAPSIAYTRDDIRYVLLDKRDPPEETRVQLAHEIAHHMLHKGNQLEMHDSFRMLQEEQTRRLALFILVPSYMLDRLWSECPQYLEHEIGWLADVFRVTYECMTERLRLYVATKRHF